jgi:UDP-3-O-acyl-N-acetylglucosamine deacetylase
VSFGGSLRHSVEFSGTGLHSGESVRVRVAPNGGKGIRIGSGGRFFALEQGIPNGDGRGSRVFFPGDPPFQVLTVEHLFAAVAGLGIGDIDMDVEGGEFPFSTGAPFLLQRCFTKLRKCPRRIPAARKEAVYVLSHPSS